MDVFFALGTAVVIVFVIYFLLKISSHVDDEFAKIRHLVKYCDECKKIDDSSNTRDVSKPNKKEILRILSNSNKRDNALKRKADEQAYELEQSRHHEDSLKERRKFASKYAEAIFEIFDDQKQLTFDYLTDAIRRYYKFQKDEDVLQICSYWQYRVLIEPAFNKTRNASFKRLNWEDQDWEISHILTDAKYKLAPSDIIRSEWLSMNGKVLK